MKAVVRAARGGLGGRRLQAVVISVVVLACTAASVLALGMLIDTRNPFDSGFAAQNGAHVTVTAAAGAAGTGPAQSRVAGATAQAGPFPEDNSTARVAVSGVTGTAAVPVTVVGRASPGGPVDDLVLKQGRWPTAPDQMVWSEDGPLSEIVKPGAVVTLSGGQVFTVTGIANSVTDTAQAWVLPSALPRAGSAQLLYRFASAGSAAAIAADISAIRHALPPGAVRDTASYLDVRLADQDNNAVWVPFIVAFGVIALAMSVLIVINVVSGAVVAGTSRIGVLKSIGFTPAQVVWAYVLQVAVPALAGLVAGAICGNLLAVPLLSRNATVYHVGSLALPLWVSVAVPLFVLCVTAAAALLPASRAGRMSAVQAIATGRAPRVLRGYRAHRVLGRLRFLPRPATIGLAAPFARPARTLVTAAAVLFGVVAVTFGAGLSSSLVKVNADIRRADTAPVQVEALPPDGGGPLKGGKVVSLKGSSAMTAAQRQQIESALRASPGTLHEVAETDTTVNATGVPGQLQVTAFGGDATWMGYALISGRWFTSADEVVANTRFLRVTGASVGSSYLLAEGGHSVTVRIVGEVFLPDSQPQMVMSSRTLSAIGPSADPDAYAVGVRPGVNPQSYANTLAAQLQGIAHADARSSYGSDFVAVISLIALLTLLLIAVAGLGVLNTVVLQLRERVHDLGVFKSVGMTPRQTIAMVVCSVSVVGLLGGIIAVPSGVWLHHTVLPVMANAASSGIPPSVIAVYPVWLLAVLALGGLVIAVAGAVGPASWAARTRTAFALRAE